MKFIFYFDRGSVPYVGVNNFELEDYLDRGRRLGKPDFCPNAIFKLWQKCWSYDPTERPSFAEIVKEIEYLISVVSKESETKKLSVDLIYQNLAEEVYFNENEPNLKKPNHVTVVINNSLDEVNNDNSTY